MGSMDEFRKRFYSNQSKQMQGTPTVLPEVYANPNTIAPVDAQGKGIIAEFMKRYAISQIGKNMKVLDPNVSTQAMNNRDVVAVIGNMLNNNISNSANYFGLNGMKVTPSHSNLYSGRYDPNIDELQVSVTPDNLNKPTSDIWDTIRHEVEHRNQNQAGSFSMLQEQGREETNSIVNKMNELNLNSSVFNELLKQYKQLPIERDAYKMGALINNNTQSYNNLFLNRR